MGKTGNSRRKAEKVIADLKKKAEQADEDLVNSFANDPNGPFPDEPSESSIIILPTDGNYEQEIAEAADLNDPLPLIGRQRRVVAERAPIFRAPELYLSFFLVPDNDVERRWMAAWLVQGYCAVVDKLEDADVVLFGGGSDVEPCLYGLLPHEYHESVKFDAKRDTADMEIYQKCIAAGIPMIGICRGAQFLHVMNGGKLAQDVDKHHGVHGLTDVITKDYISAVSSTHHQLCLPNVLHGMIPLATVQKSTKLTITAAESRVGTNDDIEAFFYQNTCCLGFQGHPEYPGYARYSQWALMTINRHINENPDLSAKSGVLRLRSDVIEKGN